ncbi:MAG: HAMP domain-containing sensor histidine kinase [Chitinophagales bacterium]
MKGSAIRNPFRLFYVVFGYTIAFSLWWGYLLFAKNETAFNELVSLNEINFHASNGTGYRETPDFKRIQQKYQRQKLMILSEGGVFFVLLVAGLLVVRRVFKIEMELADQQRNFLHSITHELKSPLASIKLSFQTLARRNLDEPVRETILDNAMGDVTRLEALVDNILFAAKMEKEGHGFANEMVNVSELSEKLVSRLRQNKQQVEVQLTTAPDIQWFTDKVGFSSVIINLVENAVKYSEKGATVQVQVRKTDTHLILSVADQGIGIPPAEREKIFEKFYRVGNEDTRKTKGTGLGLFIVKRFVEIYKGRIAVRDNLPQGSIFELELPLNSSI